MTRRRLLSAGPVRDAARQMLHCNVHRLLVIQGDDLLGVVSTSDVVRAVAEGML